MTDVSCKVANLGYSFSTPVVSVEHDRRQWHRLASWDTDRLLKLNKLGRAHRGRQSSAWGGSVRAERENRNIQVLDKVFNGKCKPLSTVMYKAICNTYTLTKASQRFKKIHDNNITKTARGMLETWLQKQATGSELRIKMQK